MTPASDLKSATSDSTVANTADVRLPPSATGILTIDLDAIVANCASSKARLCPRIARPS